MLPNGKVTNFMQLRSSPDSALVLLSQCGVFKFTVQFGVACMKLITIILSLFSFYTQNHTLCVQSRWDWIDKQLKQQLIVPTIHDKIISSKVISENKLIIHQRFQIGSSFVWIQLSSARIVMIDEDLRLQKIEPKLQKAVLNFLVLLSTSGPQHNKTVVCYISTWAVYRPGRGSFNIDNFDPSLCTIAIYAFAGLDPVNDAIRSLGKLIQVELSHLN